VVMVTCAELCIMVTGFMSLNTLEDKLTKSKS
jgi:hypothetical protein